MPMPSDSKISSYLPFAIAVIFFNPPLGIIAVIFASMSSSKFRAGDNWWARMYSNLAFSFALVGVYSTIIITALVYSYGKFPDSAYYNRQKILDEA